MKVMGFFLLILLFVLGFFMWKTPTTESQTITDLDSNGEVNCIDIANYTYNLLEENGLEPEKCISWNYNDGEEAHVWIRVNYVEGYDYTKCGGKI